LPSFQVKTLHTLGREAAIERLKHFAEKVATHYKDQVSRLESKWDDNKLNFSLSVYGFSFGGVITVTENEAALDGTMPFAALPFRGRIEAGFADEMKKALS
jgi:hypothetical protein